jgi:integrase
VSYVFEIRGITKKNTIAGYRSALSLFCSHVNQTPSTIIETAIKERKQGIEPEEMTHYSLIVSFRNELGSMINKSGVPYSTTTIGKYMSAITSFFKAYHFAVPPKPIGQQRNTSARPENQHIPDRELIRKALNVASLRDRAIILVGTSSGLAAIDICNLTVKQFLEGYNSTTEITTLLIARQKTGYVFTTCLSPEASRAVMTYLDTRDKNANAMKTKGIKEYQKIRITDDSPLFIHNKKLDNYLKSGVESDRALTSKNISEIYTTISKKLGVKSNKPGVFNVFRSHNMRRFFASALLNAECDMNIVKHFMGHKNNETVDAYYKYRTSYLEETYRKYVPYLLINESDDIENSLVYKSVEEELESVRKLLKEKIDELKEYRDTFDELQDIRAKQLMINKEAELQNELLALVMGCEVAKARFFVIISETNLEDGNF